MKFPNLGICFFFFFILFDIAAAQSAFLKIQLPNVPLSEKRFGFFIFGNSFVDAGNNNYLNGTIRTRSNFPPYGESFFPIPTGRYCDGRIIPDFLAEYAGMPFLPPFLDPNNSNYMNGVNFGSGGAPILPESTNETALSLQTQIEFFKIVEKSIRKDMGNETLSQTFLSNSVFLFNIGGGDILHPFESSFDIFNTIESQEQYANMVINNMTIALKEIYNLGGRKFGVLGVLPSGYLPSSRLAKNEEFIQKSNSLSKVYNKLLLIALQKLVKQLKGFKYSYVDAYNFFMQRIQNPTKYGFKVVDTACCGSDEFRGSYNCGRNTGTIPFSHCKNISDYLFYDSYHPTEKAYEQFAKLIWSGGVDIVKPYSFKQLFQSDSTFGV
ncbi:GDSL esterase/lipase 1 [Cucumis sativus]|uniref:Uncharacterized protein n=1 Tax=Cucumis sativus TaxID=3659 RepID=A0A0A0LJN7_CUCSA|nr:GDSL esterase/lipase 1 [Cucumis sativus]